MIHYFKTRVKKVGKPDDYINLPVTNQSVYHFTYDSLESNTTVIGTITDVVEYKEEYELTITLWDRFVSFGTEYTDDKPVSFSINIT